MCTQLCVCVSLRQEPVASTSKNGCIIGDVHDMALSVGVFSACCPDSNYGGFSWEVRQANWRRCHILSADGLCCLRYSWGCRESLEWAWDRPGEWPYQQILIKSKKLSAVIHFLWSLIPRPFSDPDPQMIQLCTLSQGHPPHTHLVKHINKAHSHTLTLMDAHSQTLKRNHLHLILENYK